MTRNIVTTVMIALVLIVAWYIPHAFVRGLSPLLFIIILVTEGILSGYTILVILKINSKKIRWFFVILLVAGVIAIYIYWKYFPSSLQGLPRRYYDIQSPRT